MWRKPFIWILSLAGQTVINAQPVQDAPALSICHTGEEAGQARDQRYRHTAYFLDAAINSLNSFNSLVKKESYRSRVASFHNPASTDMGFNLETEIHAALKPLLEKTKTVNPGKFNQVVSALIHTTATPAGVKPLAVLNPLYATLLSLVGSLTVREKRLGREDLDSFIGATSRYFVQYEKLYQASLQFDQHLERVNGRLKELQFDMKEYLADLITTLYRIDQRTSLKKLNPEELFLQYLDKTRLEGVLKQRAAEAWHYPSDAVKGAKEIAYTIEKLFSEYQKAYASNYQQIRSILLETRLLGKTINTTRLDASLQELQELYLESSTSDTLSLRLSTLMERLRVLVTENER